MTWDVHKKLNVSKKTNPATVPEEHLVAPVTTPFGLPPRAEQAIRNDQGASLRQGCGLLGLPGVHLAYLFDDCQPLDFRPRKPSLTYVAVTV